MDLYKGSHSIALHILGATLLSNVFQVPSLSASVHKPVCYQYVGCFNNTWPFDNAFGFFPDSPDVVDTVFELYAPGVEDPVVLDYRNMKNTCDTLQFDPEYPTKFIIHGFGNSLDESEWITDMRQAFQQHGSYNIILVGWKTGFPDYIKSVCNSRVVARLVVSIIEMLQRKGLELSNIHLIGHSLGAHISSYVGQRLNSVISRITGLDPAGPRFDNFDEDAKLDRSDAQFVDVIHTNGQSLSVDGGFGLLKQSGHVDFYPNGGEKQPGCTDGLVGVAQSLLDKLLIGNTWDLAEGLSDALGCSHGRSTEIFIESIKAKSCGFRAFPCPNYDDFIRGKCSSCGPKGCNFAGLQANPSADGGKQYFLTSNTLPLCSYSVVLTIVPAEMADKLEGNLILKLSGTLGEEIMIVVKGSSIKMKKLVPWTKLLTMKKDVGDVEKAVLLYTRSNIFSRRKLKVISLTVKFLHNQKRFISPVFLMQSNNPIDLTMTQDTD